MRANTEYNFESSSACTPAAIGPDLIPTKIRRARFKPKQFGTVDNMRFDELMHVFHLRAMSELCGSRALNFFEGPVGHDDASRWIASIKSMRILFEDHCLPLSAEATSSFGGSYEKLLGLNVADLTDDESETIFENSEDRSSAEVDQENSQCWTKFAELREENSASMAALEDAEKFLREFLSQHSSAPAPSIDIEEDGEIGLFWALENMALLNIEFLGDGKYSYAFRSDGEAAGSASAVKIGKPLPESIASRFSA